ADALPAGLREPGDPPGHDRPRSPAALRRGHAPAPVARDPVPPARLAADARPGPLARARAGPPGQTVLARGRSPRAAEAPGRGGRGLTSFGAAVSSIWVPQVERHRKDERKSA